MPSKQRIKTEAAARVPADRKELNDHIQTIGTHQRERARIQAAMNDEVAEIKRKYEEQAAPHNAEITALSEGVKHYCEANRDELTRSGKTKLVKLAAGTVRWRNRPPKVSLSKVDDVIDMLRDMGLAKFLREKTEVNKEAILAEPEAVEHLKGITIKGGEDFCVEPYESELEEIA